MDSEGSGLPEPKIGQEELEELRRAHADLTGFVSPRALARTDLLARLDPELLRIQQEIRRHCMHPRVFDTKTSQLMVFGMLLMSLRDAAKNHGIAARRAGATWEEMQAVANMAYLFGGLSVANRGAEIMGEIARMEAEQEGETKA
jgi:alkylhydroperoxidase/carboxymuconolactone decarboxylase family protein YurZ